MLSISLIANGEYYLELGREDYYLSGGEPPGVWAGSACTALGLAGRVEKEELRYLLRGFSPSGLPLVQNAGSEERQGGWDLTFSAPKSLSCVWAVAAFRQVIQMLHLTAVRVALDYLERNAGLTRRGHGGATRERCGLVFAIFEHGTSRAQDPQLHSHCLCANLGRRADGTWGTILSKPLYEHKMAAGAIYRAALAAQLRDMGFEIQVTGSTFEIVGVPDDLLGHFSKRRDAIEEALRSHGAHSAKAAETATLSTRESKTVLPRAELFQRWQKEAAEFGFTAETVESLLRNRIPKPAPTAADLVDVAAREICRTQSHFAKRDLVRRVAEQAPGLGLDAKTVEAIIDQQLRASAEIVRLGTLGHEDRYTTAELLRIEAAMLAHVQRLRDKAGKQISAETIQQVLTSRPWLSAEQIAAARHILDGNGSVKVVNGMPGTGKTTLLDACREAWESHGLRVIGTSLAAKAARELREGSGIESVTIAKLLHEWDRTLVDKTKYFARQMLRAAQGKRTYAREDFTLTAGTVLVLDESGMADTPAMERLCSEVDRSGATLILVGDHRQLPPIGPGGAFAAISREVGAAELTDMKRQRNVRDVEALRMIADGNAHAALESYDLRQMLTVASSREEAIAALVADWKSVGLAQPQHAAIITSTKADAQAINRLCQAARLEVSGASSLLSVQVGEERMHAGDRVLFLENNRKLGVLNGDLGTVIGVDPFACTLRVELDNSSENSDAVTIPLREYDKIQLGDAINTHKLQGATVEHAYVLLGGSLQGQEISFVQASRHREEVRFYTDRFEAGEELEDLAHRMSVSGAKELAHDVLRKVAEFELAQEQLNTDPPMDCTCETAPEVRAEMERVDRPISGEIESGGSQASRTSDAGIEQSPADESHAKPAFELGNRPHDAPAPPLERAREMDPQIQPEVERVDRPSSSEIESEGGQANRTPDAGIEQNSGNEYQAKPDFELGNEPQDVPAPPRSLSDKVAALQQCVQQAHGANASLQHSQIAPHSIQMERR